ncbi:MAG: 4Fe-4S binding protein [Planctomycetes bacterium]|nr:4Fe-4S binding protein [Planctomycetota bacterium]
MESPQAVPEHRSASRSEGHLCGAKLKNAKEMPIGSAITTPGSAAEYKTGSWRNYRPIHDKAKCTNCLFCWLYCPEGCVKVKDGKFVEFDYDYCKGCGICAEECPVKEKAIKMVEEGK